MVCFFWEVVYKNKWIGLVDLNSFEFNKKWNINGFLIYFFFNFVLNKYVLCVLY